MTLPLEDDCVSKAGIWKLKAELHAVLGHASLADITLAALIGSFDILFAIDEQVACIQCH
jgi:hypothetical protein